ncbi:transaldolase [Tolumonas auensis DSM 9187]|uniref:Transaldolase n=1 Tax=Tolumonas auensis (strain DSM 9187 / NBRC 110442 / TA 4) TaxID=595494 RepID=C4LDR5_TOLAT|nr:transaldolase [Tolumonas auensis]ACQ94676.1 transaldolase [Tolumonas auensis DSM 9187]
MSSLLQQLRIVTTVVADTGELPAIKAFKPEDATTNPSLILKAVTLPEYASLLDSIVTSARALSSDVATQTEEAADRLIVAIGCEVLKHVPGRISTEVDARLSFDTAATIEKARKLIGLYEYQGIPRSRVLIKIASTWEGIRAAEQLGKEGINCNLTLLFSFAQARACAEAGAYLISPFVGRILDWYKAKTGQSYTAENDPGVKSVKAIYQYYKQHGYPTVVMGASFRSAEEVLALAGCDRLTISPNLLQDLEAQSGELVRQLADDGLRLPRPTPLSEAEFRWQHNEDAMATEKLAEGIRNFAIDQVKLEQLLATRLA